MEQKLAKFTATEMSRSFSHERDETATRDDVNQDKLSARDTGIRSRIIWYARTMGYERRAACVFDYSDLVKRRKSHHHAN